MEKSELKESTKLVAIVTFTIARVILQLSFISIHKTIHKMSKTQTVNQEITPSFIGDPIKISLTIPTAKPVLDGRNKVPITVHLSKTGGNARFGAYVYSIYDYKKKVHSQQNIYTTILNSSSEDLLEFTTRLSKVISTKFACPSYVSVSGNVELQESVVYIKSIIDLIGEKFEEQDEKDKHQ